MTTPRQSSDGSGGQSDSVLAARLRVNAANEVRVLMQRFEGKDYVHIRQYLLNDDDEYVPTSKGVSLPLGQLGELLDAVRELRGAGSEVGTAAVIEKNSREEIRLAVATWQGTVRADIRTFYGSGEPSQRKPGKGVRFNLGLLAELERGLDALDRNRSS